MNAVLNLLADFTMFILISPPPTLKFWVRVWYWGTISFKLCPSNKCFVILLSTVLSNVMTSARIIILFNSHFVEVLPA